MGPTILFFAPKLLHLQLCNCNEELPAIGHMRGANQGTRVDGTGRNGAATVREYPWARGLAKSYESYLSLDGSFERWRAL